MTPSVSAHSQAVSPLAWLLRHVQNRASHVAALDLSLESEFFSEGVNECPIKNCFIEQLISLKPKKTN